MTVCPPTSVATLRASYTRLANRDVPDDVSEFGRRATSFSSNAVTVFMETNSKSPNRMGALACMEEIFRESIIQLRTR